MREEFLIFRFITIIDQDINIIRSFIAYFNNFVNYTHNNRKLEAQ